MSDEVNNPVIPGSLWRQRDREGDFHTKMIHFTNPNNSGRSLREIVQAQSTGPTPSTSSNRMLERREIFLVVDSMVENEGRGTWIHASIIAGEQVAYILWLTLAGWDMFFERVG